MHNIVIVFKFILFSTAICDDSRTNEATRIANDAYADFKHFFTDCYTTAMPNQHFIADNLYNYINEFSRTTVGLTPRFTSNRKFFMNMISHPKFKNLLAADTAAIQKSMVDKMKFCDESALDGDVLKQLYDREVDQTKL